MLPTLGTERGHKIECMTPSIPVTHSLVGMRKKTLRKSKKWYSGPWTQGAKFMAKWIPDQRQGRGCLSAAWSSSVLSWKCERIWNDCLGEGKLGMHAFEAFLCSAFVNILLSCFIGFLSLESSNNQSFFSFDELSRKEPKRLLVHPALRLLSTSSSGAPSTFASCLLSFPFSPPLPAPSLLSFLLSTENHRTALRLFYSNHIRFRMLIK